MLPSNWQHWEAPKRQKSESLDLQKHNIEEGKLK